MKIEIRSADLMHISGYVNAVERDSKQLPASMAPGMTTPFVERIVSGTFAKSLKAGGTLDVTIVNTNSADEVALFGAKVNTSTGVLESGKDDVVPDVMCIYSTMTSDGKINLYKFPKCKFTSQGENVQTTDENGVTFNSLALQANYKALINTGVDMYCVKGLDPVADKASIDAWFATASGVIVAEV